jgi:hypothetical protein
MNSTPVWIVDPGHAWLEVDVDTYPDVLEYGTGFGYLGGNLAYLEEDMEAPAFLVAHPEIDPRRLRTFYFDDDAPCRMFRSIPVRMTV